MTQYEIENFCVSAKGKNKNSYGEIPNLHLETTPVQDCQKFYFQRHYLFKSWAAMPTSPPKGGEAYG